MPHDYCEHISEHPQRGMDRRSRQRQLLPTRICRGTTAIVNNVRSNHKALVVGVGNQRLDQGPGGEQVGSVRQWLGQIATRSRSFLVMSERRGAR